eukprot:c10470_g1_i1.p3 GENE.c10470_g1_i1~~c10470_g1_i1.p3  ORF type:complete len:116 (+),score=42.92 c10470_g1_i1:550-897(+)
MKEQLHQERPSGAEELHDAVINCVVMVDAVVEDILEELPALVAQVYAELGVPESHELTLEQWLRATQLHPEFLELVSVEGLSQMVQWATLATSSLCCSSRDPFKASKLSPASGTL